MLLPESLGRGRRSRRPACARLPTSSKDSQRLLRAAGRPAKWKGRSYGGIKLACVALLAWWVGLMTPVHGAETNVVAPTRIATFSLEDQYGKRHTVAFPHTNITVLTVADEKGSAQVDDWVAALKQHYHDRVDLIGVAAMDKVPSVLRGLVESRFRKRRPHPVMLDWTGRVTAELGYTGGDVTLLLVDRDGTLLLRVSGRTNDERMQQLFRAIDQAISPQRTSSHPRRTR